MSIGVLAMVGLSPERAAALTLAGYAVREGKKYPNQIDAVCDAGDSVRAVLTNGRGGLTTEEMAFLPKLEVICAVGAGYEAVDLATVVPGLAFQHRGADRSRMPSFGRKHLYKMMPESGRTLRPVRPPGRTARFPFARRFLTRRQPRFLGI